MIQDRQKSYASKKIPPLVGEIANRNNKINFQADKDIVDFREISKRINDYDTQTKQKILYWLRQEIEGITASPLKKSPVTSRKIIDIPLVGRQEEYDRLLHTDEDLLIIGQPGSGKTFLLYKLAQERDAYFISDTNPSELLEAIKILQPEILIVDDAHQNPDLLTRLRYIRENEGCDFRIVASCWPISIKESVKKRGHFSSNSCIELEALLLDDLAEILKELLKTRGLHATNNQVVQEIIEQANGCPGILVVFFELFMKGEGEDFFNGKELLSHLTDIAKQNHTEEIVWTKTKKLLAYFSIGGKSGMTIPDISNFTQTTEFEIRALLTALQFGGLIVFKKNGDDERVIIRPSKLRAALVKEELFAQGVPNQLEILKSNARLHNFVEVILDVAALETNIPDDLLQKYLTETGTGIKLWEKYYWIFPDRIIDGLRQNPDTLCECLSPGLAFQPNYILPLILDEAGNDQRQLNQPPNHSLQRIKDWLSWDYETEKTIERRELLLDAVSSHIIKGGNQETAMQIAAYIISPNFDVSDFPPGSGSQVTFKYGLFKINVLQQIYKLWPRVFQLIKEIEKIHYLILFDAINAWAHPARYPKEVYDDEVFDYMRDCAVKILFDMATICKEHPGLRQYFKENLKSIDDSVKIDVDDIYEILHPERTDYIETSTNEKNLAAVKELAEKWKDDTCKEEVLKTIIWVDSEAALVGNQWQCLTPALCHELAKKVNNPVVWGKTFSDKEMLPYYVLPFLEIAVQKNIRGWKEFARGLIESKIYLQIVCDVVFQLEKPSGDLGSQCLDKLSDRDIQYIKFFLGKKLSIDKMKQLLSHSNSQIAFSAAIGEWLREPEGNVRNDLIKEWKQAILEYGEEDHYLRDIFEKYPNISNDWLIKKFETNSQSNQGRWVNQARFAIEPLKNENRKDLLKIVNENLKDLYGKEKLIRWIVGDDLKLYQYLFEIVDTASYDILVLPLTTLPNGVEWAEKAILAHEHGISLDKICNACLSKGFWEDHIGKNSIQFRKLRDAFEELEGHSDTRIKQIASRGYEMADDRMKQELISEREREIYGYDEVRY